MGQTWILMIISILFVIGLYKHIFHVWVHDFDALVSHEMLFFSPFFLKSNFITQIGQTWILIIISILLVTAHYKYILFIGIHGSDALVLQENFSFHYFL